MKNRYSDGWYSIFLDTIPHQQTLQEVNFLSRQLSDCRHVLDIGCGTGRHMMPLAQDGFQMIGFDHNANALHRAPDHANCQYINGDMRRLPFSAASFDAVMIMWQSFGYFDAATNLEILRQIASLLHDGGRLVLDIYNRDFFENRSGIRETIRAGQSIHSEQTLAANRLTIHLTYATGEDHFEWQVFSPAELHQFAGRVGFRPLLTCANFDDQVEPSANLPRMQIILEQSSHPL